MASNVLPLFWHLSSADKKARIEASETLVGALETFQQQYHGVDARNGNGNDVDMEDDDDDENEDEEDENVSAGGALTDEDRHVGALDRAFEKENSEDVKYSVKRLVRGLASSRESSRLGFAVALTEVSPDQVSCSSSHL